MKILHSRRRVGRVPGLSMGVAVAIAALLLSGGGLAAQADDTPDPDALHADALADSIELEPVPVPSKHGRSTAPQQVCSPRSNEGVEICVERADAAPPSADARSARSVQSVPTWCLDRLNAGRTVTRTQDCETFGINISKKATQNGVTRVVGTAVATVASYQYTSYSTPVVAHQLSISVSTRTGDISGLVYRAVSECSGSCTHLTGLISDTAVAAAGWHEAESFTQPTNTAVGAMNYLATQWKITIDLPGGAGAPTTIPTGWFDLRCDNAAGGSSPQAGCAVYYAPGAVTYSSSTHPALTNHIAQAVASGLPGGSSLDPLHRTDIKTVISANRAAACGSAPSIPGLQCDEYPFASTYEGASGGGAPRSFPGCSLTDPPATGPGFSRCMIDASQNMSGGTILGNTYRQQRILEADPYYVRLTY